jgi:tetratricopeptide (TPR) repeat protein
VFVEPAVKRTAFAEEPGTTIVSIGGVPGQAYEPSGWEVWAPVRNLYEEGNYEAVIERGRELIEANPQYSLPLYNLACCESLAGRKEDALAHLRQALEKSDRVRAYAKEDSDFDAIRDEPAFREMIGT